MKHVVIDLEMNPVNKEMNQTLRTEVIEIGAVALDENLNTCGTFHCYVKPQYGQIKKRITKLTGITDEMLAEENDFASVMEDLVEWLGTDEVHMYSWSMSDQRQLQKESEAKAYVSGKLASCYENWTDLQEEFRIAVGNSQSLSLDKALKSVNYSFEGKQHGALTDAQNTAHLFRLMEDKQLFEKTIAPIAELFHPQSSGFLLGDLIAACMVK